MLCVIQYITTLFSPAQFPVSLHDSNPLDTKPTIHPTRHKHILQHHYLISSSLGPMVSTLEMMDRRNLLMELSLSSLQVHDNYSYIGFF